MNTYTKLNDGSWGLRVDGDMHGSEGRAVVVATRAGARKEERIGRVLWSGADKRTGHTVSLCMIARSVGQPRTAARASARASARACKTGGNCSSLGSGRSCGAEECDGW